ncbi:MAG: MASE1 domain-containing protein [Rhodanobacter sp.]
MQKGLGRHDWLIQVAVAVGYALAYIAIRPFSDAHWSLTSGLRLACLLFIPYRYWLALAVGEVVPLTYSVFQCVGLYGFTTAAIWSVPPIAIAMPVVWYCRRHLSLFPARYVIDVKSLLICALATSLLWAVVTYIGFVTATDPAMHASPVMMAGVFIGDYVAILTLVTWPLVIKLAHSGRSWKSAASAALTSPLAKDTLLCALPVLLLIAIVSELIDANSKAILEMFLFAPVAWLTLKYGWRGTASCGPLAVACICLLTQSTPDPIIIQTQAFIAFAVTCLFLMGARIASHIYVEDREKHAVKNALRVAQECIHQGEIRLRQTSHALELTGGTISLSNGRILDRAHHFLSLDERQRLTRQVNTTKTQIYRLAESIHPIAWRERGLPAALHETIGRSLDEAGIKYDCLITGRGLSQLAPALHQTIYRLASEAVATICAQQTYNHVRLILRGGVRGNGQHWAVLRVIGMVDSLNPNNLTCRSDERQSIGAKLGTSGMSEKSLRGQAALFDGTLHVKKKGEAVVITVLLHDAQHLSLGRAVDPPASKLWVR